MSDFVLRLNRLYAAVPRFSLALAGAFLYAFGLNGLLVANGLSDGGFAGLSALLHFLFGTSVGALYLLFNLPLLLLGIRFMGISFMLKTVAGSLTVTLFLLLTDKLQIHMDQKLLASFIAGALLGIGRGLMFRSGYTTGGIDIVAFILHKFRKLPQARTILAFDVLVMTLFACLISLETALYSIVALYISSRFLMRLTPKAEEAGASKSAARPVPAKIAKA